MLRVAVDLVKDIGPWLPWGDIYSSFAQLLTFWGIWRTYIYILSMYRIHTRDYKWPLLPTGGSAVFWICCSFERTWKGMYEVQVQWGPVF